MCDTCAIVCVLLFFRLNREGTCGVVSVSALRLCVRACWQVLALAVRGSSFFLTSLLCQCCSHAFEFELRALICHLL